MRHRKETHVLNIIWCKQSEFPVIKGKKIFPKQIKLPEGGRAYRLRSFTACDWELELIEQAENQLAPLRRKIKKTCDYLTELNKD